ncbi:DUF3592 domain-containing protein [Pseudomonas inefficax]|uniref:DUF3592 domain-containing protein n=1 Tax=Pseudomonas inefficax TaxID=2078786 RepID=UPI004046A4BA
MIFRYFSCLVLLVGLVLLLMGASHYVKTNDFLAQATITTGRVVALERGGTEGQLKPRVRFLDHSGSAVEFTSWGSKPPAYSIGEQVEVAFLKDDPRDAQIKQFMRLWVGVLTMVGFGSILTLIGWGLVRRDRRVVPDPYDFQRGSQKVEEEVEADIYQLICDHRVTVDGQHPFTVVCHWLDPETNELHELISDHIYFNPAHYLSEDTIRAVINHRNPNKSYLDLSFLPDSAG